MDKRSICRPFLGTDKLWARQHDDDGVGRVRYQSPVQACFFMLNIPLEIFSLQDGFPWSIMVRENAQGGRVGARARARAKHRNLPTTVADGM
jgi:hypothetical protein